MTNQAYEMLVFIRLAYVSERKKQRYPRDKFLLLAAVSGLLAGYPDISARCHRLVLEHQPGHLIAKYPDFTEAYVAADFQPFLQSLKRFCSFEQAEHLLKNVEHDDFFADRADIDSTSIGDSSDGLEEITEIRCAELSREILADGIWQS